MSDETKDAAPEPAKAAARWSWQGVLGVLLVVAGFVVRRILKSPADPTAGTDIQEGLTSLGIGLLGWAAPLPPFVSGLVAKLTGRRPGGGALTGLVMGGLMAGSVAAAPGCGTFGTVRNEDVPACFVAAAEAAATIAQAVRAGQGDALGVVAAELARVRSVCVTWGHAAASNGGTP